MAPCAGGGRRWHQPQRRDKARTGQRFDGRAVLIGNLRRESEARRAQEDRDNAVVAGIAGNGAGTTVNNHAAEPTRGV